MYIYICINVNINIHININKGDKGDMICGSHHSQQGAEIAHLQRPCGRLGQQCLGSHTGQGTQGCEGRVELI